MKGYKVFWGTVALLIGVFFLSGCAPTQVTVLDQTTAQVPRPDLVSVYDFAASPDEVTLDQGISARIKDYVGKTSRTAEERAVGRAVAKALSKELVKEITALGFNVGYYEGQGRSPASWGNAVQITGQFLSIDEGNRTERIVIGLGAGRSDVKTLVQVYDAREGQRKLLSEFDVDAKSGYKPGMAETAGAGAAAGHLVTAAAVSTGLAIGSEEFKANVEADAKRTAKSIMEKLKAFFQVQGWL